MAWKRRMQLFKIFIGTTLGVLVYVFMRFDQSFQIEYAVLSSAIGSILAFVVHWNSKFLDRKVNWREKTGLRLILGILIQVSIVMIVIWLVYFELSNISLIKILILVFSFVLLYNIIYFIFYSYNLYAEGQVRHLAFKAKQTRLQFDALRSQLSPHFLFNSLNALSALFHKNLDQAERFIRSLAKAYKYVLGQYEYPVVSLSEELAFANAYFEMMAMRFGSQLKLECNIPENLLESKIPPLTIQMLIENAIKHNSVDAHNPLTIKIFYREGYINVSNNKLPRPSGRVSTNIGLRNIAERFELLYKSSIVVTESNNFNVALPILIK
jgi:sensor histidine kinase YesM